MAQSVRAYHEAASANMDCRLADRDAECRHRVREYLVHRGVPLLLVPKRVEDAVPFGTPPEAER
jgi:hypothetical protein